MRELTKSMMSYSWAMSLFGVQQMVNVLTPNGSTGEPCGKSVQAFANVTKATTALLDGGLKEAFKMGDSLQQGMLDFMFGGVLAGGFDPNRWARAGGDVLQKMTDLGRSAASGAGFPGTHGSQAPSAAASTASDSANWGPMPS